MLYLLYLLYLLYCLLYLLRTGGQAARSTCEALTLSLTLTLTPTKARAYEEYKRGRTHLSYLVITPPGACL